MADGLSRHDGNLRGEKFLDPEFTADGKTRASVSLRKLDTLWINTGTLCNIECAHCYIHSSPRNDRLAYISESDIAPFMHEAKAMGTREIGFTGGEPFMNPAMPALINAALDGGFDVLVLTNAMQPMMRPRVQQSLREQRKRHGDKISLRISIDHFDPDLHDSERGDTAFSRTLDGMRWLHAEGFALSVAARLRWGDREEAMRDGFASLFSKHGLSLNAHDTSQLILFPELDESTPVPEITTECWSLLGKSPEDVMCASSRMVVKRKDAPAPTVLACTLLPYDKTFELGASLEDANVAVPLNHPHCAKFCVLGGASCSG